MEVLLQEAMSHLQSESSSLSMVEGVAGHGLVHKELQTNLKCG